MSVGRSGHCLTREQCRRPPPLIYSAVRRGPTNHIGLGAPDQGASQGPTRPLGHIGGRSNQQRCLQQGCCQFCEDIKRQPMLAVSTSAASFHVGWGWEPHVYNVVKGATDVLGALEQEPGKSRYEGSCRSNSDVPYHRVLPAPLLNLVFQCS